MEAIKPLAKATERPGVLGSLGGFGGLFDPRAAGYADPILVASTDGVGTKLRIAAEHGRHDTIGIDLVAMCVNDLVAQGAEPLFFLDYFATGRLDSTVAEPVIEGVTVGCRQAGCALLGGETAEMPGHYQGSDYDLAGFAVGAAERGTLLPRGDVAPGDVVLGFASDGVHSNGYSLVRRICADAGLSWSDPAPFDPGTALGDALLRPTRVYVAACLAAIGAGGVKALAHITGGGLTENIPRVLPGGMGVALTVAWDIPPVFTWLAAAGGVSPDEMARTFNCGIGMAVVCEAARAEAIAQAATEAGERVTRIGEVVAAEAGSPAVRLGDWAARWPG